MIQPSAAHTLGCGAPILSGRPRGVQLRLRGRALLVRETGGVSVLGHLHESLRQALEAVFEHRRITSPGLAEVPERNLNIACNRLNALQRQGLVWRCRGNSSSGGGRQYSYESLA